MNPFGILAYGSRICSIDLSLWSWSASVNAVRERRSYYRIASMNQHPISMLDQCVASTTRRVLDGVVPAKCARMVQKRCPRCRTCATGQEGHREDRPVRNRRERDGGGLPRPTAASGTGAADEAARRGETGKALDRKIGRKKDFYKAPIRMARIMG